ncbi:MAG: cupin domain-containing protein [bacterium]
MPDINSDFSQRVVLHTRDMPWISSPIAGVDRRMLDRLGDETARATSIVRYAPDSHFSPHVHHGGEEFVVLEGVFEDEHGSYPSGTYIRNPPTSRHTPGSTAGCIIFVKLWQFDPDDRTHIQLNIEASLNVTDLVQNRLLLMHLYQDSFEFVRVERWQPDTHVDIDCSGGAEILVLNGGLTESEDQLSQHAWCRLPDGYKFIGNSGEQGCTLWIKSGHLIHARRPDVNQA